MKKEYIVIIAILAVAFTLRFWQLTSVPPALNWDEAVLGYNAYSILNTGRDEYGQFLPLVFKSFGDFKPGIYVYLTVPFVAFFGLTEFGVRAPSALFGILTVLLLYFLVKELFSSKRLAVISATFLAISPWHLLISRPALEANIALFFNLAGIYFFLKFLKGNNFYALLSASSFLLSIYTYQGSKLIVPLILTGLIIFWFKQLLLLPKKYLLYALSILLLAIPIYFGSVFGQQGGRLEVFSVFSYPRFKQEINQLASEDQLPANSFNFQLFHNEGYNFGRTILSHYLNHISSRFLFFEGDYQDQRIKIPDNGVMYLFDIIFLTFGGYVIIRSRLDSNKRFLLYWLAISPLPAALSRDLVHPIRAANLILPLIIIAALGASLILERIKILPRILLPAVFAFGILIIWNVAFLLDSYFLHYPQLSSRDWLYGHKQVVELISKHANVYDNIIFTTAYNEPYIFTLFYSQYPPQKYQPQAKLEPVRGPVDVGEVPGYNKYLFRPIYYPADRDLENSLIIGTDLELPEKDLERDVGLGKVEVLGEVNFLNGETAFKIVGVK